VNTVTIWQDAAATLQPVTATAGLDPPVYPLNVEDKCTKYARNPDLFHISEKIY
jgi:hypothetical protein